MKQDNVSRYQCIKHNGLLDLEILVEFIQH